MVTFKSFTSLEQSKKLAEILPLESADMYYTLEDFVDEDTGDVFSIEKISFGHPSNTEIPCWSLASLLGVLPYCPDLSKHTDGKWYITTYPNDVHTCLMAYDNPVDACYEMIIRLNELKML